MADCRYCEASFDDEEALDDHLRSTHAEELGPIDRRRVGLAEGSDGEESPFSLPLVVGGVLAILLLGGVVWISFFAGSGGNGGSGDAVDAEVQPTNVGQAHFHGTIEATIDGERLDFTEDRYVGQDDAVDFHGDDATAWHAHSDRLTIEYTFATVGIDLTEDSITYEGETYVDGEGYEVRFTVNGDPVDPTTYTLADEDHIEIVVEEA